MMAHARLRTIVANSMVAFFVLVVVSPTRAWGVPGQPAHGHSRGADVEPESSFRLVRYNLGHDPDTGRELEVPMLVGNQVLDYIRATKNWGMVPPALEPSWEQWGEHIARTPSVDLGASALSELRSRNRVVAIPLARLPSWYAEPDEKSRHARNRIRQLVTAWQEIGYDPVLLPPASFLAGLPEGTSLEDLPTLVEHAQRQLAAIGARALVMPGGGFFHPWFSFEPRTEGTSDRGLVADFGDLLMVRAALTMPLSRTGGVNPLPIVATCRAFQLLGVAAGFRLIQNLQASGAHDHSRDEPHAVRLDPNSVFALQLNAHGVEDGLDAVPSFHLKGLDPDTRRRGANLTRLGIDPLEGRPEVDWPFGPRQVREFRNAAHRLHALVAEQLGGLRITGYSPGDRVPEVMELTSKRVRVLAVQGHPESLDPESTRGHRARVFRAICATVGLPPSSSSRSVGRFRLATGPSPWHARRAEVKP